MPRKTPVRELQKEEPVPSSPLRRSSRINTASPVPTKVVTRRNSATEAVTSTPKPTRSRRSSVTQDEEPDTEANKKSTKPTSTIRTRRGSVSSDSGDLVIQPGTPAKTRSRRLSASKDAKEQDNDVKKPTTRRRSVSEDKELEEPPRKMTRSRSGSITKKTDIETKSDESNTSEKAVNPVSTPMKKSPPAEVVSSNLESIDENSKESTTEEDSTSSSAARRKRLESVKVDLDLSVIAEVSLTEEEKSKQSIDQDNLQDEESKDVSEGEHSKDVPENDEMKAKTSRNEDNLQDEDGKDIPKTDEVPATTEESTNKKPTPQKSHTELNKSAHKVETSNLNSPIVKVLKESAKIQGTPSSVFSECSSTSDASFSLQLSSSVLESSQKTVDDQSPLSDKENISPEKAPRDYEPMEVDEVFTPEKSIAAKSPAIPKPMKMNDVGKELEIASKVTDEMEKFLSEDIKLASSQVVVVTTTVLKSRSSLEDKQQIRHESRLSVENTELALQKKVPVPESVALPDGKVDNNAQTAEATDTVLDKEKTDEQNNVVLSEESKNPAGEKELKEATEDKLNFANEVQENLNLNATDSPKTSPTEESQTNNQSLKENEESETVAVDPNQDENDVRNKSVKSNEDSDSEDIRLVDEESLESTSPLPEENQLEMEKDEERKDTECKIVETLDDSNGNENNVKLENVSSEKTEATVEETHKPLENSEESNEINEDSVSQQSEETTNEKIETVEVKTTSPSKSEVSSSNSVSNSTKNPQDLRAQDSVELINDQGSVEEMENSFVDETQSVISIDECENDNSSNKLGYQSPCKKSRNSEKDVYEVMQSDDDSAEDEVIAQENNEQSIERDSKLKNTGNATKTILISDDETETMDTENGADKVDENEREDAVEVIIESDSESKDLPVQELPETPTTITNDRLSHGSRRQSLVLQEKIKAGEDNEKCLSDKIHRAVDLFCSEIKNKVKTDVSINVSLEYSGLASDPEDDTSTNKGLVDVSFVAVADTDEVKAKAPGTGKRSKRRKISHNDEEEYQLMLVSNEPKSTDDNVEHISKTSPVSKTEKISEQDKSVEEKRKSLESAETCEELEEESSEEECEDSTDLSDEEEINEKPVWKALAGESFAESDDNDVTWAPSEDSETSSEENSDLNETGTETHEEDKADKDYKQIEKRKSLEIAQTAEEQAEESSEEESEDSESEEEEVIENTLLKSLAGESFADSDDNDVTWVPSEDLDQSQLSPEASDDDVELNEISISEISSIVPSSTEEEPAVKENARGNRKNRKLFRLSKYDFGEALKDAVSETEDSVQSKKEKKGSVKKNKKKLTRTSTNVENDDSCSSTSLTSKKDKKKTKVSSPQKPESDNVLSHSNKKPKLKHHKQETLETVKSKESVEVKKNKDKNKSKLSDTSAVENTQSDRKSNKHQADSTKHVSENTESKESIVEKKRKRRLSSFMVSSEDEKLGNELKPTKREYSVHKKPKIMLEEEVPKVSNKVKESRKWIKKTSKIKSSSKKSATVSTLKPSTSGSSGGWFF